ncbi:MAG: type II secretion system minor pseudopilin GspI [Candidatus Competibacteraceae bacterium]|nr:type II secretion system minor pseudopilin GspI [Candidatus Competibacteraceae bacterium]
MKQLAGFTLLEVLVALAVLAIAMGAIIGVATQSVNTVGYLRDQTFASWAALNKVNELLLASEPWPTEGSSKGTSDLANRTWRWETRFQKTQDPDLTRLDITIRADDNGPVLTALTAFKGRPPPDEPASDAGSQEQQGQQEQPEQQAPEPQAPTSHPKASPHTL